MTKHPAFTGSLPALVTPFKGGRIDEEGLRALVDWQIESGSHGLVPVGTTGESPTLCHDEHKRVVEIVVDAGAGPGAGHRRRRLEQHVRGGRPRHPRREGRRRRAPRRHALLQQADPGGHVPALQGGERCGRHSDHHLQHPAALGGRHVGRDDDAALRAEEHRRRQGRHRQSRPRLAAAPRHGRRISSSSRART